MIEIRKAISLVEMVESLMNTARRSGSGAALPLEGLQLTLEQIHTLLSSALLDTDIGLDEFSEDLVPLATEPRRVTLAERVRMVPKMPSGAKDDGFVRELAPQQPKRRAVG